MGYIYCLVNSVNNKKYIGQTKHSPQIRFLQHLNSIKYPNRNNSPLYQAIAKYGKEKFSYFVIEECDDSLLDEREQFWISEYNTYGKNGYNATRGGQKNSTKFNYKEIAEKQKELKNERLTANFFHTDREVVRKACKKYNVQTDFRPKYDYEKVANKFLELKNITKTAEFFNCDRCVVYLACKKFSIDTKIALDNRIENTRKQVCQIDPITNQTIASYPSITEACIAIGKSPANAVGSISEACKNQKYIRYGYKWKYLDQ